MGEVEVWTAKDINADLNRTGLTGSPTRVLETKENLSGRRRCKYITADELSTVISESLKKSTEKVVENTTDGEKLKKVFCVGQAPLEYAKAVCENPTVISLDTVDKMAEFIKNEKPDAVIWGSDSLSKQISAQVAAMLNLGLCADCTSLQTDGQILYMVRPALAGSVVAKIKSITTPAMATVRTTQNDMANILVAAGFGVKENLDKVKTFAESIGADLVTTRKMVDNDFFPYEKQVGLTGKTVAPSVYIALGVAGVVHHIVGMQRAGTVIAINPDKDAPIFDYADYGIIANFEDIKF